MVFTTSAFLLFLLLVCGIYAGCSRPSAKRLVLLLASYIFYAAWDWRFCGLVLLTTLVDYFLARRMDHAEGSGRKRLLILSLIYNLGVLGTFKYLQFFADSFVDFLALWGLEAGHPELNILLPVGISFYTFQSISYMVDVYRKNREAEKSLFNYALYLAFFPQLLQGPIERAGLMDRFAAIPVGRFGLNPEGLKLILIGAFKKVVLADNLAQMADPVFSDPSAVSSPAMLVAMYAYTFQLYLDFSGYTDIARGLGRFFGVELSENFRSPYAADDPSDFWRRWHITLSNWLRDYLYIPLGGNRCSSLRRSFNLMATMLLAGLWHGAGWTFLLWGGYHGLMLTFSQFLKTVGVYKKMGEGAAVMFMRRMVTFHLVALGWVAFRCQDLADSWSAYGKLTGIFDPSLWGDFFGLLMGAGWHFRLLSGVGIMLLAMIAQYVWREHTDDFIKRRLSGNFYLQLMVYVLMIVSLILFAPDSAAEFIYFRF